MKTLFLVAESTDRKDVVRIVMYDTYSNHKHIANIAEFDLEEFDFYEIVEYLEESNPDTHLEVINDIDDRTSLSNAEVLELLFKLAQSTKVYDEFGQMEGTSLYA
jgi:hypothetical protein